MYETCGPKYVDDVNYKLDSNLFHLCVGRGSKRVDASLLDYLMVQDKNVYLDVK